MKKITLLIAFLISGILSNAQTTVTIYGDSNDGIVAATGSTWSAVRSATTGTLTCGYTIYAYYPATWAESNTNCVSAKIDRAFLFFNTSSIPDDACILSANLKLSPGYTCTYTHTSVCAMKGVQNASLALTDFDAFTGSEYGHVTWDQYNLNTIAFNSTGINDIDKTGTTKICCREYQYDYLNSTPATGVIVYNDFQFGENANKPALEITYLKAQLGTESSICSGTSLTTQNVAGCTYQWSRNGTNISGATTYSYVPTQTGNYCVTITTPLGCTTSACQNITTIWNTPVVNLGADGYYCPIMVLDAGNPGCNYSWSTGATSQAVIVPNTGTVCVTVTNPSGGCQSSDCIQMYADKSPCTTFTYTTGCNSNCRTTIAVQGTCSPYGTHNWQMYASDASGTQGSLITTGSGTSCTLTSTSSSFIEYYLIRHYVENRNCVMAHSDQLVHVTPATLDPDYNFTTESGEYSDHYHIQAIPHTNPSCIGFWWQISDITGGTPTNVMTNPSNWWDPSQVSSTWFPGYCCDGTTLTGKGTFYYNRYYRIERGVWSGCAPWTATTPNHVFYVSARLQEPAPGTDLSEDIKVYTMEEYLNMIKLEKGIDGITLFPNPSKGKFTIDYNGEESIISSISVCNQLGDVVFSGDSKSREIDLSDQSKGVYFVKITTNNNVITKKLILQ